MADDAVKVAAVLVLAFGGGIALGYFLAPKAVESTTGGYVPLYVPSCDEVEE
ncbi:MAG: hypothetical protein M0R06_15590 [Sphaerochaeta sp.]|jgi:uncharacterized protein YneF (UPF0154 family)|nr:hypothetical protein [Sphaerochaeta sp.]